jgi:competence protein ComEA
MMKSLLLKLGMLAMTIGVVFWARWAPQPPGPDLPSATEKVVASPAKNLQEKESRTAGSSGRSVQGSNIEAVAQLEPLNTAPHSRLDLNRASAQELESLPGIGAVMAQRVIAFRKSAGGFRRVEDLREVKGIGAKKFDRLKSLVTVSTAKS